VARHNINSDGTWRYTNAIDRFPVQPGDVWEFNTGHHIHLFVCGDLQGDTPLNDVLASLEPTLVYVDPPYNAGLARGYRTKAGVDNGPGRSVDMSDLWQAALWPAVERGLTAYVETSSTQQTALEAAINWMAGEVTGRWGITYYRKHPSALIAADFNPIPSYDHPDLHGMDDEHTPLAVLTFHPAGVVLDPCAGRGLTARSAHTAGWSSVSHELSPFRMAEAIHSLHKLTGVTPERRSSNG
jgi:hypothetical protein